MYGTPRHMLADLYTHTRVIHASVPETDCIYTPHTHARRSPRSNSSPLHAPK